MRQKSISWLPSHPGNSADYQQPVTGGSLSISATGIPTGGALSSGKSNINSHFQSVAEQSGLKAGDGGFQVAVKKDTDLKGGVISSTEAAVALGRNTFTTGALSYSDIRNSASYSGTASGFTIGVGSELSKSGAGIGSKSGDASSTTQAAISGIAGNKEARTGDAEAGIKPIFDRDAVRNDINAQVAITTAFGQQGAQAIGNYAQTRLEEALKNKDQAAIDDWKEGGPARVALHAALGALTGNLGGALGAAGSQAVLPWLGEQINQLDVPAEVKQALLQAAGSAVGAALGGVGGASSALNATAQNYLRHEEALLRAQLSSKLQSCKGNDCLQIREQIDLINKTDIWRDQQIEQACKNPSSAECRDWNKDLQTALASYNDKDMTVLGLRNAAGKASSLADLYQNRINNPVAYGVATSLLKNAIGTATGVGQLSYTLTKAVLGDAQAQQDLRQTVTAIRDTVSDPSGAIVAQLEAADRADAAGNPAEAARIRTDLVLVVGGTTAGASALGKSANNLWKAANSLDNVLGDVKPSSNGFISTRQLTEERMPARLSNAELAELNKMPQAANTTARGNIGETVMDSYFARNGYTALDGKCGAQCFDGVYLKDGKVYINEVKPMSADGSIQLSGPNAATGLQTQMTERWIRSRVDLLKEGTAVQK